MTVFSTHKNSKVSLFGLALVYSSSFCSAPRDATVSPNVDVIDHSTNEFLSAANITSITGTYGAGCRGRTDAGTDSWTISIAGGPAFDELRVSRDNATCVLTLANINGVSGTFTGSPGIALGTANAYASSASAFARSTQPVEFYANGKISTLTYASNFTISILLSQDATALDGGADVAEPQAPPLASVKDYVVVAGTTVTNSGLATTVSGDLCVSPGTSVTGMPPGQPTGEVDVGTGNVPTQVQTDLTTLYEDLSARVCPPANVLTGQDLAGKTLAAGVYCFASSASLTAGTLTLDAKQKPDAFWIFQIGSTLSVSALSTVRMINQGNACNVFWQVGSSATVANATLTGNVVALTSITLDTSTVTPRALARNGAVTMTANNHVSNASCK